MGHSHAPPSTRDGNEDFGEFLDKRLLLLKREHQVAVALVCRGKRRKDSAAHAEVRIAHVRTLFGTLKAKGNPPEVVYVHRSLAPVQQAVSYIADLRRGLHFRVRDDEPGMTHGKVQLGKLSHGSGCEFSESEFGGAQKNLE